MGRYTGLFGSAALVLSLAMGSAATAQDSSGIDFGDDSSAWANDGQCDDPRFTGPGAAMFSVSADEGRDATDCRDAFTAGTVTLAGSDAGTTTSRPGSDASTTEGIDFGDDSSIFANDGQCDDPRFSGPGVWSGANNEHVRADASDCREAIEAGTATFVGGHTPIDIDINDIDFGDDSSIYANDGQCDDPRFSGRGVWSGANNEHLRADASDCREAVEAGDATYIGEQAPADVNIDDIDFGDDSSTWSNDGQCDDPRFSGPGVWSGAGSDGVRADATDCREAVEAGTATYLGEGQSAIVYDGIDFGDDSGNWPNDGQCDDPRFEGAAVWSGAGPGGVRADASDCLAAYQAGDITYAGDDVPGASGNAGGAQPIINFGNDSSAVAFNGVCDDPRFQGPGGASLLYAENEMTDASDCRAAHEAGTIDLQP